MFNIYGYYKLETDITWRLRKFRNEYYKRLNLDI